MGVAKSYNLYAANDQDLDLTLVDGETGQAIIAATVTFNLYDQTGTLVPNAGPITLNPTTTPGGYMGLLSNLFNPPTGGGYVIKLDINQSGVKGHLEIPAVVLVRTS